MKSDKAGLILTDYLPKDVDYVSINLEVGSALLPKDIKSIFRQESLVLALRAD